MSSRAVRARHSTLTAPPPASAGRNDAASARRCASVAEHDAVDVDERALAHERACERGISGCGWRERRRVENRDERASLRPCRTRVAHAPDRTRHPVRCPTGRCPSVRRGADPAAVPEPGRQHAHLDAGRQRLSALMLADRVAGVAGGAAGDRRAAPASRRRPRLRRTRPLPPPARRPRPRRDRAGDRARSASTIRARPVRGGECQGQRRGRRRGRGTVTRRRGSRHRRWCAPGPDRAGPPGRRRPGAARRRTAGGRSSRSVEHADAHRVLTGADRGAESGREPLGCARDRPDPHVDAGRVRATGARARGRRHGRRRGGRPRPG